MRNYYSTGALQTIPSSNEHPVLWGGLPSPVLNMQVCPERERKGEPGAHPDIPNHPCQQVRLGKPPLASQCNDGLFEYDNGDLEEEENQSTG